MVVNILLVNPPYPPFFPVSSLLQLSPLPQPIEPYDVVPELLDQPPWN
uniref:Uncharacterized protein n=1 Tax=Arundo donax TaxID=35708 RepID=A0A0A9B5T6_ARUDO